MSEPTPLTSAYHWTHDESGWTNYETLLRPDGSKVTMLTEPEDRTSYRDLAKVTDELNAQAATVAELQREIEGYRQVLQLIIDGDCDFENGHDDIDDCTVAITRGLRTACGSHAPFGADRRW